MTSNCRHVTGEQNNVDFPSSIRITVIPDHRNSAIPEHRESNEQLTYPVRAKLDHLIRRGDFTVVNPSALAGGLRAFGEMPPYED
jgi:hypothetical protein